ncbi:transketolase C-terminal domain-containing protein [Actinobaculum sp. 313]|uniref:transketolase C-terminal domain-containing protein n=1 Tax=Actinobaculum sp. 313 TaxID=2495645 RepID=UPI00196B86C8|nr:transketolase C-terminal domain-containing protein [Actinobaculum sp. 313]
MKVADFTPDAPFEAGKALRLHDGGDVTIISTGIVTPRALAAAENLTADGISARVLHMPCVKPLDTEAIATAAQETGAIVTVEEGTTVGALGGAVCELVTEISPIPVRRLGVPDEFPPTGSETWILDHYGVSAAGISCAARALLELTK